MTVFNMLKRDKRWVSSLLLAISMTGPASAQTAGPPASRAPDKTYNFSPVNQHSLELTATYWNPILKYVSDKSGVPLSLRLSRTSAETTAKVVAGDADFSFTNHLFSPERAKLGWTVFGRRDAPPVQGQILVLADSPIKSLADLAGKDVAFPGPEALVAYKTTYAKLLEQKIAVTPVFAGNLDAAFSQVIAGRVFAMGSNSQMTDEYASREKRNFRVLWSSPPFNDLALMASPRVPRPQLQAVAKAFTGMHLDAQGKKILEDSAKAVNAKQPIVFVAANDDDYASYRDFYRNAPASLR